MTQEAPQQGSVVRTTLDDLPFGDDLALDALDGGVVGRHITSAELFEVLR